jgi:septum formation protein
MLSDSPTLILASASPRRHELLEAAGIPHLVRPSHIPEDQLPGETPFEFVRRIALKKAKAVNASETDIVLGADTMVCVGDAVVGKPMDECDAARMLRLLSGRDHRVITGFALCRGSKVLAEVAETRVWFEEIPEDEIASCVRSGQAMDKAGAYAIQGYMSRFVQRIEGSYHNVVGLPVSLVYRRLKEL